MTVFGVDYRSESYQSVKGWRRIWPLVRLEFGALFRGKWGTLLFVFCALPSLFRLFFLLVWTGALGFGAGRMMSGRRGAALRDLMPDNREFYVETVVAAENGMFVIMLLMALATARVIAKDRATNALEFYWTRGISPWGYFLAKWLGSTLLVGLLTVAAPVFLWTVGVLLAEDWTFFQETVGFMPRAVLGLMTFTVVLTLLCTLLSAITATANLATILWCLLLVGGWAVAQLISDLSGDRVESWLSLWGAAGTLARSIAGISERGASAAGAWVFVGVATLVLGLLARRNLRLQGAIG